jgi:hypothetical protein
MSERDRTDLGDAMIIDTEAVPSGAGCIDCESTGGWWLHLRRCAQCGHVGCCDSSPNQHARAHADESGHRVVQSYEPDETWFYDFAVEEFFDGPRLADPQHRPAGSTSPGPAARVPVDWRMKLR